MMNSNILTAIESLCGDIVFNTSPEDNKKRAEAIVSLAFANIFTPAEYEDIQEETTEPKATPINDSTPKAGEHFNYNGIEFVALGNLQGGMLSVVANRLDSEMPYDENDCNDWRSSTLRKFLNEEYIKNFVEGDLMPITSDLTADNGDKSYGNSEDFIALLSDDLYRKYRDFVPKYDSWVWTVTPYSCAPGNAHGERYVNTSGALLYDVASNAGGVAPACIFNPSIFE
jgi:hypothetical protein